VMPAEALGRVGLVVGGRRLWRSGVVPVSDGFPLWPRRERGPSSLLGLGLVAGRARVGSGGPAVFVDENPQLGLGCA
jgi:hypothetical protein